MPNAQYRPHVHMIYQSIKRIIQFPSISSLTITITDSINSAASAFPFNLHLFCCFLLSALLVFFIFYSLFSCFLKKLTSLFKFINSQPPWIDRYGPANFLLLPISSLNNDVCYHDKNFAHSCLLFKPFTLLFDLQLISKSFYLGSENHSRLLQRKLVQASFNHGLTYI